jgi:hypothetical protein
MIALIVVSVAAASAFKVLDHPRSSTDVPTDRQAYLLAALFIVGSPALLVTKIVKELVT